MLSEVLVPNAETLRSQSIAEGVGFSPRFSALSATLRCKTQDDLFELALAVKLVPEILNISFVAQR
ncbi:MAG: hypothetical protein AABZ02_00570, partial [Bacteroidota bacterium]